MTNAILYELAWATLILLLIIASARSLLILDNPTEKSLEKHFKELGEAFDELTRVITEEIQPSLEYATKTLEDGD